MIPARRTEILEDLATNCLRVSEDGKEFVLHGGGTSKYFLDVPHLFRRPRLTYGLMVQLENLLDTLENYEPCSFVSIDTGGTYCALLFQQHLVNMYSQGFSLYRVEKAKPLPSIIGNVILIDDVLTTGSSILPIIQKIQGEEVAHILQFITVVNRQEGEGEQRIHEKNISYSWLFTFEEILWEKKRDVLYHKQ